MVGKYGGFDTQITIWLVVSTQPLWKMMEFVSWDDDIPNWMEKYNSCSKPPTSQKIEVNPKLVVSKSHPYVVDVLGNLAITDWRWQSANVHLKSWQRDVRKYKNNHLLWEKIWSSYGDSSECGHFLGYIQNLLGSNPQKFPALSRSGKEGNFATESLGAPTLWHRMFRTILEMETIFMAKTCKDCEKGIGWKERQLNWHSAVHVCPEKISWTYQTPADALIFFVERKHQISRANPTPTWRPRASASSDWWPICGAFPPVPESDDFGSRISSDFMATPGISMSGIQKRLWTLVFWQSKHTQWFAMEKKSGTQRGRNDDVFFQLHPL